MALGTVLPFWPALLFTYIEPIALIFGWHATLTPNDFVKSQTPSTPSSTLTPVHDGSLILAYATGNVFLLLAALAVLCTAITRDARVAKWYLLMVAIADLGHVWSTYQVLGPETFINLNAWTDTMWGNNAFSAFLHVNRLATVLGVFGKVGRRS